MLISITSFLTAVLFSNIMIVLVYMLFRNVKVIKYISINIIIICIMIAPIRLLFPIELNITKTIPCEVVFPPIMKFLRKPLLSDNYCFFTPFFVLLILWIAVSIYKSFKSISLYLKFNQLIRILPPVTDKHIKTILEEVIAEYPRYISFRIVQTPKLMTPFIYYMKIPTIVLPNVNFTDNELYNILRHEVAHYYNHDFIIKAVFEFLCIMYWWNPFIFLLKKQFETWLEIHTDITAVKNLNSLERINYFDCLIKIAKKFKTLNINNGAFMIYHNQSMLKKRFYVANLYNRGEVVKKNTKNIIYVSTMIIVTIYMSFSVIFEPYFINSENIKDGIRLSKKTAYFVENKNSGYDVYYYMDYWGNFQIIYDDLLELPIYQFVLDVEK